jgi:hypothetical protein
LEIEIVVIIIKNSWQQNICNTGKHFIGEKSVVGHIISGSFMKSDHHCQVVKYLIFRKY